VVPRDGEHGVLSGGQLSRQVAATGAKFGTGVARQPRARVIAIGAAIVALIAGTGVYLLTRGGATPPNAPVSPGVTLPGPFRVISMTPAPGARRADGSDPVQVTFSAPVAAGSPPPSLTPDVPGRWQSAGDTLTFLPRVPVSPSTLVTVTVPAGVRSARGRVLARAMTAQFTTEPFSSLALADLLGQLGYLPGSWQQPNLGMQIASKLHSTETGLAGEMQLAYDPPSGSMNWDQEYPASLASLWRSGSFNVIIRGAVMAFQSEHNMTINGEATSALWSALFRARGAGQNNVNGYTYAVASKGSPEMLTIWHNGAVVLRSLANTGIPSAPTVDGTFPVYERFLNTIMSGTNPDGSHYSDPVQYVSYFNGGDAVHYFPRGGYGSQQSLGCVELPYTQAKQAYPYLTYGSLVTVTG
jgi:peptidoglycan hydrolase-like protein with peptidoglycan-binding domain